MAGCARVTVAIGLCERGALKGEKRCAIGSVCDLISGAGPDRRWENRSRKCATMMRILARFVGP